MTGINSHFVVVTEEKNLQIYVICFPKFVFAKRIILFNWSWWLVAFRTFASMLWCRWIFCHYLLRFQIIVNYSYNYYYIYSRPRSRSSSFCCYYHYHYHYKVSVTFTARARQCVAMRPVLYKLPVVQLGSAVNLKAVETDGMTVGAGKYQHWIPETETL